MVLSRTIRPLLLAAVMAGLLLCAAAGARAQHHGGGGGGGGGGFGGRGEPREGMGGSRDTIGNRGGERSAPAMRSGPQLAPPGRWWNDGKTVKKLDLRPDQTQRMDDIFNANKGALLNGLSNLQHEESRLNAMSPQDLQDKTKVFAAIDRVAQARTDLAKAIVHYQMQLREQLNPAQLSALDKELARMR